MSLRPILYYFISFVFLLCSLSLPAQVICNYQIPFSKTLTAFTFLTSTNLTIMALYFALAIVSYNSSRAVLALVPTALLLTIYNNYLVGQWAYDYSMNQTAMSSGAYIALSLFPILPAYYKALKDPSCRWWLVAARKPIEIPVRVSPTVGSRFHSFTVDISKTGAFIETHSDHLDVGDEVDLRFSAQSVKPLQIKAQVVRKGSNQRQTKHEFGYGVRFADLDPNQKKVLDRFLSTH